MQFCLLLLCIVLLSGQVASFVRRLWSLKPQVEMGLIRTRVGTTFISRVLARVGNDVHSNQYIKTLYDADQHLIDHILSKEYSHEPKSKVFVMPKGPIVPFKNVSDVSVKVEFQDLLGTLNSTQPPEVNDYEQVFKEPEEESTPITIYDPSIKLRPGVPLSSFDHSEEDIDDDNFYSDVPIPQDQLNDMKKSDAEKTVVPGEPNRYFFFSLGMDLEAMPQEEFDAYGLHLWENQLIINEVTRDISHHIPGLLEKYKMANITALKQTVMKEQAVQDRYWEAFEFQAALRALNETMPDVRIDHERENDLIDCEHPKKVMVMARTAVVDGNTTAVAYILDIFDYIREYFKNDDRIGYTLELLEPVLVPDIDMTEDQWEIYQKHHPIADRIDRVEVKDGFVKVVKKEFYCSDGLAREYPPQDPIKSVLRNVENSLQMWCEGHNIYHLINGLNMKIKYGGLLPHALNSAKNRERIARKILYALEEEDSGLIGLSHDLARIRIHGGADVFVGGVDTDVPHPSPEEDCVVTGDEEDY